MYIDKFYNIIVDICNNIDKEIIISCCNAQQGKTKTKNDSNSLEILLKKYPDKKWNWNEISKNPNITERIIENNPDKPWSWEYVSKSPGITPDDIERHPEWPWNWDGISQNPNLTMSYILKNPDKPWLWTDVSENPGITPDDIENNIDMPWIWRNVSRNPNLTFCMVKKYPNMLWDWTKVSENSGITMHDIEKFPDWPWIWQNISGNPNLSIEMVDKYPDKPWNWTNVSKNPAITIEMLNKYPDKPWDWTEVSRNPSLTIRMIKTYPHITWNWNHVSENPGISMDDIENNIGMSWNWNYVSKNPNLTFNMIDKNMDLINFETVLCNTFSLQNKFSVSKSVVPVSVSVFVFYSKSADKSPGTGAGESLVPGDDFIELGTISNWRKVLSNFHYDPFEWKHKEWSCIEEAYQAAKFGPENYDAFQEAVREKSKNLEEDAGLVSKKLGKWKVLSGQELSEWNRTSRKVMKEIAKAKYKQSKLGRKVLLLTKNAKLLHYLPRNSKKYEHFTHLEEIRNSVKAKDKVKDKAKTNEIVEINGDLFNSDNSSLAHCIAKDLGMGKGIAAIFKKKYGGVDELRKQSLIVGSVGVLERNGIYVYYLITKERSNGYPKLSDLKNSLISMKDHALLHGVRTISMPRIGSGLDKLIWSDVKNVIIDVFDKTGINIKIYWI